LSQEQLLNTFVALGFDEVDARIYVFLAKKGMQKACDINTALKLTKQQFYPSIKRLQSKGIVNSTMEHPARFSAMPFEKVLDFFIRTKNEETRRLEQSKSEILSNWQNLKLDDDSSAKFTVIEGRTFIYSKIQQMLQEATIQVLAITTVPALAQANHNDVFNTGNKNSSSKIRFRFLAELSEQNGHIMDTFLKEMAKVKLNFEGRNPDLGMALFPHMVVKDEDEVLLFTKPRKEKTIIEKDDACLWTDCKPLVQAFTAMFEELWRNSTDIRERLVEIKTGNATPKTLVIGDAKIAEEKYNKTLLSAREDITIMTSSKGLIRIWKDLPQHSEWRERGVVVKIMAPIMSENLEAAKQLSQVCSVKHVPPNHLLTSIIDGKQLFQFKEPSSKTLTPDSTLHFENAFYTNNQEYVQKTKAMLNEIWRNSSTPSSDNLKTMFGEDVRCVPFFPGVIGSPGPYGAFSTPVDPTKKGEYPSIIDDDPYGKMTEQDVLSEIVAAQKTPQNDQIWIYSSQAVAIIHPPDFFNLPRMLFRAHHIEKHSTFSEQDVIIISLWLETSCGYVYVPVAVLGNRPQAQSFWEKQFSATPAGRNFQLVSKDELQIRVHGNTLFAGWTVPIPLYPSGCILPPACILIEGYGDVKTDAYRFVQPTGEELKIKQNGFDAFVTFMHPSSKYSGPGTDGFLIRDFVLETTPQFFKGFKPKADVVLIDRRKT
jgi:sugar-specific transcriptional regulator TrmB